MNGPLERVRAGEILCGDGGWGTMLMARGLKPGDSPEALNLTNPEALVEVARLYVDAGAELITTNTFGGSSLKLEAYSLDGDTEKINAAAIEALKPVVEGKAYISASIGPCGKLLKPYGDTEPEAMAESFSRQIGAVIEAGTDIVCIETMIDLTEAQLAIKATRSISSAAGDQGDAIDLVRDSDHRHHDLRPDASWLFHDHGRLDREGVRGSRRGRCRRHRFQLRQRHREDDRDSG